MKELRIDWNEVRKRMIDLGVDSLAQLSAATGINKNTLSKKNDTFFSTTVNRLADYLGCDPLDIVTSIEATPEQPPIPKASDATRQTQRYKLTPPGAQATPQQLAAEAERRKALLAQAEGRREGK